MPIIKFVSPEFPQKVSDNLNREANIVGAKGNALIEIAIH